MAVYFTSDTHFGHDAIRVLADRPFATVNEMDDELVRRWNAVVTPNDTVWHVGDFAHRNSTSIAYYRRRLNGVVHLVLGNHDRALTAHEAGLFASVQTMAEVHVEGATVILCHYPMREWAKAWRGAWHLFGHVHGRLDDQPHGFSMDVCVDSHGYAPVGIARIKEIFATRANPFVSEEQRSELSRRINRQRRAARAAPESGGQS